MVEGGGDVGDFAGVHLGALAHGGRPVVHDGETGAGQGQAQVNYLRVVGAGGVGAQEHHQTGAALAVGDDVDVAGSDAAVIAGELGDDVFGFAGEPGLRLDRRRQHLRGESGGVDGGRQRAEEREGSHDYHRNHQGKDVQAIDGIVPGNAA